MTSCVSCGDHPALGFWCHNCCLEWDEPYCSACGQALTEAEVLVAAVPQGSRLDGVMVGIQSPTAAAASASVSVGARGGR